MSLAVVLLFLLGLAFLVVGSEWLVRGASRLAAAVGVSPLVVGLTIVSLGTTSPEMAVSIQSAFAGQSELAVGNVVGSCVLNILLILGLSALILPLEVPQNIIRFNVPLLIFATVLLWGFARDGSIARWEGAFLAFGAAAYILYTIVESRRESRDVKQDYAEEFADPTPGRTPPSFVLLQLGLMAVGLTLLVLGSRWMVDGAVAFARQMKVNEVVIGLTVIAIGTSLPEIATTIVATLRKERDIAVGNVIGSNLLNILNVLGVTALLAPTAVIVPAETIAFDIPVTIAVAVACLPVFFNGGKIARWEGGLFFGLYVAYTLYLILAATQNAGLPLYRAALVWFALPLTAVTIAVVTARNLRAGPVTKPPAASETAPNADVE
jgi:cation:H+ antiporter